MATVKYDVSDVEAGGGEQPPAGVHKVKIAEVNDRRGVDNHDDLEVIVDFGGDYARVWSYLNFGDSSKWKFREFTDALGLKPKGQFDPSKLVGKAVNVKIIDDTYQGDRRARIKTWLKPGSEGDDGEEPEVAEEPEAGGDDDTNYTEWTVEDLEEEINNRGLDMPKGRKTVEKLADVLLEYDANNDGGNEPDADAEKPEDDYDDWPANELKDELEERIEKGSSVEMPELASGRGAAAKNKTVLIEALREDDAEEPF